MIPDFRLKKQVLRLFGRTLLIFYLWTSNKIEEW
jgi:hypothetical protein